ncbi:MAG: 6-phosphogluconolactonase [Pseudomonadota bacterium]|jgi:6-phosphogluconolactonase|nr:6-phosphogluconolactonase [Syntrophobacterales bacterium]MDI9555485.1 6-phosphogluconolactonase [Pseudomonadota bacterium]HNU85053.1 6-phosphogluconolactonase [Syntrophales bacterium]HNZ34665.1 6-phosphogluconolactonase [Syntrophales bacterium]HOF73670.1 6-phosphogluconolactonase [Syntrophales bacterium]
MTHLDIFSSPAALAGAAATLFAAQAAGAVSARGRFTTALSGGRTPETLYGLLAAPPFASQIPWGRVHLFWGDERCVPPDHRESNYRFARERLLDHVPIPPGNVHRIRGEMEPAEAAALYEKLLRDFFGPHGDPLFTFDLVLLGLGEDGHTASLFPGTGPIRETARWVVGHDVDARKGWRITLTPAAINAARTVVFLVAGKTKAAAARDVLEGSCRPGALPAQAIRPLHGELRWMLDREAAQLLRRQRKDDRSGGEDRRKQGSMEDDRDLEEALLVEDLHTGELVVERANGEKWVLDAKKGWCPWGYEFEGRRVRLRFGEVTSVLVNDRGERFEFWTDKQIE